MSAAEALEDRLAAKIIECGEVREELKLVKNELDFLKSLESSKVLSNPNLNKHSLMQGVRRGEERPRCSHQRPEGGKQDSPPGA